jgi:uncharacterized protein (DUF362 family)/Pyruvate/2-oxoacid:ferredoxin oxidoreductase delta subunit
MTTFKVAGSKCKTYEYQIVKKEADSLLKMLGGAKAFIKPGQKVLLKPNMLSCKTPDKVATTHPALVQALAEIFKDCGAEVIIGDSPPVIFGRSEKFWQTTGFAQAAKNSGAKLVSFENESKQKVDLFTNNEKVSIHLVKLCFEVDLVVNIAKLKTHNLTRITGAIKNLYGLVPGLQKAQWHKIYPKSTTFSNFMTDLASKTPCQLNFLDAIEGMDGQGPSGGRKIYPGFLLASTNPVAIDRVFCALAGLDEEKVPMLKRAKEINWGPSSIKQIKILGQSLEALKFSGFNVPNTPLQDYIPDNFLNFLKRFLWAGPALKNEKSCISCGRCARICPVQAISIKENGAKFDRKTCISCFCCMEVCPVDAIVSIKSPILEMGWKIRNLYKKDKVKL